MQTGLRLSGSGKRLIDTRLAWDYPTKYFCKVQKKTRAVDEAARGSVAEKERAGNLGVKPARAPKDYGITEVKRESIRKIIRRNIAASD